MNREEIIKKIKSRKVIYADLPHECWTDEEISTLIIEDMPEYFSYVSQNLKSNKDFVKKSLNISPMIYSDISHKLKQDVNFNLENIHLIAGQYKHFMSDVKTNKNIVYKALKSVVENKFKVPLTESAKYKTIHEIELVILRNVDLNKDGDFIEKCVEIWPDMLQVASNKLKEDKKLLLKATEGGAFIFKYMEKYLYEDFDFIYEVLKKIVWDNVSETNASQVLFKLICYNSTFRKSYDELHGDAEWDDKEDKKLMMQNLLSMVEGNEIKKIINLEYRTVESKKRIGVKF